MHSIIAYFPILMFLSFVFIYCQEYDTGLFSRNGGKMTRKVICVDANFVVFLVQAD